MENKTNKRTKEDARGEVNPPKTALATNAYLCILSLLPLFKSDLRKRFAHFGFTVDMLFTLIAVYSLGKQPHSIYAIVNALSLTPSSYENVKQRLEMLRYYGYIIVIGKRWSITVQAEKILESVLDADNIIGAVERIEAIKREYKPKRRTAKKKKKAVISDIDML